MIEIAGDHLEGGGQIVRTAVGLSALTGKPCRIFNIRQGRKKPGLATQHMKGIEAAAGLCHGQVEGLSLGSQDVVFQPAGITGGRLEIDIGTAGSIPLILQTLILPSLRAERDVEFEITGGTHVRWAPSFDYFQEVFCATLLRMGAEVRTEVDRVGFYPKGGGTVRVKIRPARGLEPLILTERGDLRAVFAESIASRDLEKAKVAERQILGVEKVFDIDDATVEYVDTYSIGSSIHLTARFPNCRLGASSLGERGKPAERVGNEAARLLSDQIRSGACLDRWMADQILPYLALAEGESEVTVAEVTNHCLTNICVIEKFLPVKFEVTAGRGSPARILVKPEGHLPDQNLPGTAP
jgi:RNA 3'-terminal phosphate cyclase (ATP)/RNA 3'-terminal phosphate cyclase (GTP)